MATTNLGKVSVTPKGEYDPLITYERLDVISHNGSSYIVKQASIGVTPIEGEFYALIAEKGDGGSFVKKAYKTYAAMDADKVNIPANSSVDVTNDPDESKNGAYIYDGVAFTRSQYDSKVVTDKIISDTATAVQDAINNTAVEGGVLADTFVTMTKKSPEMVARNLREINAEKTSIADFGKPTGDDWTDVVHSAIPYGKPIHFPMGVYKIRKDRFSCGGNSILFYGDKGAEIIIVDGSDDRYVFDASDSERIEILGFTISSETESTSNRLLWFNPESYVSSLILEDNTIEGYAKLVWGTGSLTQDPFDKFFGFDYISISNNKALNSHFGVFTLGNFPCRLMVISGNTVRNFGSSFANLSINNSATNKAQINSINEYVAEGNVCTTDTDYWSISEGSYITFLLVEGRKVTWKNNDISGLKTREDASLCDSYLSCSTVLSHHNTVRNIGNFSAGTNRTIFHMKKDKEYGLTPRKELLGNRFIIESDWLTSIGETDCVYRLSNFGVINGGAISMQDCVVEVPTLISNYGNIVEGFSLKNNTIKVGRLLLDDTVLSFRFWDIRKALADNPAENYTDISGESVVISDGGNMGFYYFWGQNGAKDTSISVAANTLTVYNSQGVNFLHNLKAGNGVIKDNYVNGKLIRDIRDCEIDILEANNNTYSLLPDDISIVLPADTVIIGGTGRYSAEYNMNAPVFRLTLLGAVQSGTQHHKVCVSYQTAGGFVDVVFYYTSITTSGSRQISFTNTSDEVVVMEKGAVVSTPIKTLVTTKDVVTPLPTHTGTVILTGGEVKISISGLTSVGRFSLTIDTIKEA